MQTPGLREMQIANFNEILYADDTICCTSTPEAMQNYLRSAERIGSQSGLKLNKDKCVAMILNSMKQIKFTNGQIVKDVEEAKYLGCIQNKDTNMAKEISHRINLCSATLTKLDTFWYHSNCKINFKVRVFDAVIRSKLMYGLESAHLLTHDLDRLDTFHRRGLRKILNIPTTYAQMIQGIDRTNNNELVYQKANEAINKNVKNFFKKEEITPLSIFYKKNTIKRMFQVSNNDPYHPVTHTTFDPQTGMDWKFHMQWTHRGKDRWERETMAEIWKQKRKDSLKTKHI